MTSRAVWVCVVGVGLLACGTDITIEDAEGGGGSGGGGSTSSEGGGGSDTTSGFGKPPPGKLEVACKKYCDQAAPKGCPEEPGCEASCSSLAAVGCLEPLVELMWLAT